MGCSLSNSSIKKDKDDFQYSLIVQIVNPKNQQIIELPYNNSANKKKDYIMNIMNSLFFTDDRNSKMDVCFNSLYSKKNDRYHYYLNRLLNIEIENIQQPYSGKMWVLYIQNIPADWDQVVNNNVKFDFSKRGKIVWRYEKFTQTSPELLTIQHEMSQENNLDYLQNVGKYQSQDQSEPQTNINQKQSDTIRKQSSQIYDKSTTDHTFISSLKQISYQVEDIVKKKLNGAGVDAPQSLFNPEIQGHPKAKNILDIENFNIYQNKNVLNTEEDVNEIQPPLQTEANNIENLNYLNVFEKQQNNQPDISEKNLFQNFSEIRKSYQIPDSSIYQHNTLSIKDELNSQQPQQSEIKRKSKYFDGDQNIQSGIEIVRKYPSNIVEEQDNLQFQNKYNHNLHENDYYNQKHRYN